MHELIHKMMHSFMAQANMVDFVTALGRKWLGGIWKVTDLLFINLAIFPENTHLQETLKQKKTLHEQHGNVDIQNIKTTFIWAMKMFSCMTMAILNMQLYYTFMCKKTKPTLHNWMKNQYTRSNQGHNFDNFHAMSSKKKLVCTSNYQKNEDNYLWYHQFAVWQRHHFSLNCDTWSPYSWYNTIIADYAAWHTYRRCQRGCCANRDNISM